MPVVDGKTLGEEEFDKLAEKSTLPEKLDYDKINKLLIESRKKIYNID